LSLIASSYWRRTRRAVQVDSIDAICL